MLRCKIVTCSYAGPFDEILAGLLNLSTCVDEVHALVESECKSDVSWHDGLVSKAIQKP
jgi:hypothetical protein